MRYLKEIIRAKRSNKNLPGLWDLLSEYSRWKTYQKQGDVYKNAVPWITLWAIDCLNEFLRRDMRVFEFGGGGSTLYFAKKVNELVTVEHNKEWFDGLTREMKTQHQVVWRSHFVEPEDATTQGLNRGNPDHYFSDDQNFSNKIFKKYASVIDQYPDQSFDVVLIDGRVRPSCLKHSLNKVKKGGLLILDNADRTYYLESFKDKMDNYKLVSDNFGPTPYVAWFTQTNIWKRED